VEEKIASLKAGGEYFSAQAQGEWTKSLKRVITELA